MRSSAHRAFSATFSLLCSIPVTRLRRSDNLTSTLRIRGPAMLPDTALQTYLDSGPPHESADYTTVVIVHGYVWHGGNFTRLLPLAHARRARIVVVNRRGYPGSAPFDDAELSSLAYLASTPATPENAGAMLAFVRERTQELYSYLAQFVAREHTPIARGETGGIILVGWSFGTVWMNAFLANVASLHQGGVDLRAYIRRVVYYDGSYVGLGQPPPPITYPPEPADGCDAWLSGYYPHGDVMVHGASALSFGPAVADPSPTTTRMTPGELEESTYHPAGAPGGCDRLLTQACMRLGTYEVLQKQAFYFDGKAGDEKDGVWQEDAWPDVEVRVVWCDHTEWEMPWGAYALHNELRKAREAGKATRNVEFVRLRGANHFAHWDMPEKLLDALLQGIDSHIEEHQTQL